MKKGSGSVLLAHCYQPGRIQDMADFVGDSFQLAKTATEVPEKTILFAGVRFMAETAAILSPDKDVFPVSETAGCPMADMITPKQLRRFQEEHPGSPTLCYVNSTAEVKALSDMCCTSSTAVTAAKGMNTKLPILFVPDRHLGEYTGERAGCEVVCWNGYCNVHVRLTPDDVRQSRAAHPDAVVMAHPECVKEVRDTADHVLSTGGMMKVAKAATGATFLVGTEIGLIHTLRKANPNNTYLPLSMELVCPNMKMSTTDDIQAILAGNRNPIRIPEETAAKARRVLMRMLEADGEETSSNLPGQPH